MLTSVMRLPSTALHVARRTTSRSMVVVGEAMGTAFPSLSMPVDRIAMEAWALGMYADQLGTPSPTRRARTS